MAVILWSCGSYSRSCSVSKRPAGVILKSLTIGEELRGPKEKAKGETDSNVSLPGDDRAAKRGIEKMFLQQAPGDKFLRLIVTTLHPEALRNAVFHFIGVAERGVRVEADELREIVDAGDVAIGDGRFDGVLIALAGFGFIGGPAIKVALQRGKA